MLDLGPIVHKLAKNHDVDPLQIGVVVAVGARRGAIIIFEIEVEGRRFNDKRVCYVDDQNRVRWDNLAE